MKRLVDVRDGVLALRDDRPRHRPARVGGRSGGAGGPACVVLLHGFTGSAASWSGLSTALRRTRRVIAIDLPGHGATRMHAGFDWSLAGTAAAIRAALDALDVARYALVGYSMGGRLALQLALDAPDRVAALILESASAGLATTAERAERRHADEALATALESGGIAAFVARWEALPLFRSLASVPEHRRQALRRQRLARSPPRPPASPRGMGPRAPARRIPHARLKLVDAAGHLPHLEQPRRFHALVRAFLDASAHAHSTTQKENLHAHRMA